MQSQPHTQGVAIPTCICIIHNSSYTIPGNHTIQRRSFLLQTFRRASGGSPFQAAQVHPRCFSHSVLVQVYYSSATPTPASHPLPDTALRTSLLVGALLTSFVSGLHARTATLPCLTFSSSISAPLPRFAPRGLASHKQRGEGGPPPPLTRSTPTADAQRPIPGFRRSAGHR